MSIRSQASDLWHRLMLHGQRNKLPFSEGNQVRPLLDGAEILGALRSLIAEAQATLHFEIYAWADDETGRCLLTELEAARERGVQVRGMVDHLGSWSALEMLKASRLNLRFYHPISWRLPWRLWHRRNHRKLLIADGASAVVSSANWADAYNCGINTSCYRDLGLELQGPVVLQLEEDFRRSWTRTGGEVLAPGPGIICKGCGSEWIEGVDIQLVSSLNGGGRALRRHLLLIIKQLRHRALIANAYFIPDPQFLRVLLRAARRGIELDLIVPGDSDHPFVQAASRATFGRLAKAGVRIWERQERMLHAKVAVLDEDLAVLGSANLDSRSFRHNLELNLMLRSRDLTVMVEAALEAERRNSQSWSGIKPIRWSWFQRTAYLFWWWL